MMHQRNRPVSEIKQLRQQTLQLRDDLFAALTDAIAQDNQLTLTASEPDRLEISVHTAGVGVVVSARIDWQHDNTMTLIVLFTLDGPGYQLLLLTCGVDAEAVLQLSPINEVNFPLPVAKHAALLLEEMRTAAERYR